MKDFATYEQALELKELGFNNQCLGYYNSEQYLNPIDTDFTNFRGVAHPSIPAPLKQQVFRWFREKQGLYSEIFIDDNKTFGYLISYFIEEGRADKPLQRNYNTYEEAEDACIDKLIEITKDAISNN